MKQKSGEKQATSPSDPSSTACHISILIQSPSKQQSVGIASLSHLSQSRSSKDPTYLSISSCGSGITSLHQSMLQAMWEKAEKLLNDERGLQPAAS